MHDLITLVWRFVKGRLPRGDELDRIDLKDADENPIGIIAVVDHVPTQHGLDWHKPEPTNGRRPTQTELDDLFDTQREQARRVAAYPSGIIRGKDIKSGVLSASAPVDREVF